MAVVLGLALVGALAFFLLRRRRRNARGEEKDPTVGAGAARKSELGTEKPAGAPTYRRGADVKNDAPPSELPAVSSPQELPADEQEKQRVARVDDRAAAGYEGAYRGN